MISVPTSPSTTEPTPPISPSREAFLQLRSKAADLFNRTRFREALVLYDEALELAREMDDPVLADRAFCGRTAAALELGEGQDAAPRLREVLMRAADDENSFLAAYILATQVFDPGREYRKSLFYARIAHGYAKRLDRTAWLASCHNQIANMQLAMSFFDEACGEYERALRLLPEDALLERALVLDNVGYCRIVQGRHKEGFRMLFWSLRTLRRLSARRHETLPLLSLCFAYMEIGRHRRALRHGYRALQIAEAEGDAESTKNALFLLGEAANAAGAPHIARRFFHRLQTEFYPGESSLAELLLTVNARSLFNLKA